MSDELFTDTPEHPSCAPVREDMAAIVDGDEAALERHLDHLSMCDACRDLRHELASTAALIGDAGADYEAPDDMGARVLAALDAPAGDSDRDSDSDSTSSGASAVSASVRNSDTSSADSTASARSAATSSASSTSPASSAAAAVSRATDSDVRRAAAAPTAHSGADAAIAAIRARRGRGARRRAVWLAAAAAVIGIGGVWLLTRGGGEDDGAVARGDGSAATIDRILRAAPPDEDVTGLSVRLPDTQAWVALAADAQVPPGARLRTDASTRVRMTLDDGTVLALDHQTEIALEPDRARHLSLASGQLVADVAANPELPAVVETPAGQVEVPGTQLGITATDAHTSVRVTRGLVRLRAAGATGAAGDATGTADTANTIDAIEVRPGEEGLLRAGARPVVAPVTNLADSMAWAELGPGADDGEDARSTLAGIGELRAFRPGESRDKDWPLTLSRHKVTVRIAGNVARTEIEETFANDANVTLEGVYRFPLPPDARIDKLALDVAGAPGGFEEGAFVSKDRAKKIWAGVIRNAAPKRVRKPDTEIIWVPGPWRDPALLEWQRGGRFELRVFPIPARGARTVKIAYTQTIRPHGERRRYVYPLAHAADGSTAAGQFDVDVQVVGADPDAAIATYGYPLETVRDPDRTKLTLSEPAFVPRGNLIVEYSLPGRDAELSAWTFQGQAAAAPGDNADSARAQRAGADPDVVAAQRAIATDSRATALIALRPKLPRWTSSRPRDYVIAIDASQSMVGERYARARRLVAAMVAQMDRRDRFTALACDVRCESLPDAPSGALRVPSPDATRAVEAWLASREPAGASDVLYAVRTAADTARTAAAGGDRDAWVLYVGDGVATMGHRRAAVVASEVTAVTRAAGVSLSTVGIGADADADALAALARSGGGHFIPYTPGQRSAAAALAVLETSYGVSLRDPRVRLPDGLRDASPGELTTIRAGDEILIAGRMDGPVRGEVVLEGTVAGEPFRRAYPVELVPSTSAGNAFVPRMWAALAIADLEHGGRGEDRVRAIALSKAYGVLSRHTSLLVLESDAMFRAFGVDRSQPVTRWTGEEKGEAVEVALDDGSDADEGDNAPADALGGLIGGTMSGYGKGGGAATRGPVVADPFGGAEDVLAVDEKSDADGVSADPAPRQSRPRTDTSTNKARSSSRARPPSKPKRSLDAACLNNPLACDDSWNRRRGRRGGQWMRQVRVKVGSVVATAEIPDSIHRAVARAEDALSAAPDSREAHRRLVQALSYAGALDRAFEVASQWLTRDRLDPEALVYMSDVLGRQGQRGRAIRLLSGVVDIAPDNADLHRRLARAYDRGGDTERACAHRVTLAELSEADATSRRRRTRRQAIDEIGDAIRCERQLGHTYAAAHMLRALPSDEVRREVETAAAKPASTERVAGELVLSATWSGAEDIDLTVVTPQGTRLSWLGGRKSVRGDRAMDVGRERLALSRVTRGNYLIEVSRVRTGDSAIGGVNGVNSVHGVGGLPIPIRGNVEVTVLGERQTLPFALDGDRALVGRIRVRHETRLEPIR